MNRAVLSILIVMLCGCETGPSRRRYIPAVDDTAETALDTPVLIDVLANDEGGESSSLTLYFISRPQSGTALIVDNAVRYTPPGDFTGTVTFNYNSFDEAGRVFKATVTVEVRWTGMPAYEIIGPPPADCEQYCSSNWPTISGHGRYVAFKASDMSAYTTSRIFIYDRLTGAWDALPDSTEEEPACDYGPAYPQLSHDGQTLIHGTWFAGLGPQAVCTTLNAYVYERSTQSLDALVRPIDPSLDPFLMIDDLPPSISADAQMISFNTYAQGLVADPQYIWTNQVFVHDRQEDRTEVISLSPDGQPGNAMSYWNVISPDGGFVAFGSGATNLLTVESPFGWKAYLWDRESGALEWIDVPDPSLVEDPVRYSMPTSISDGGRYVAFDSTNTDLVPNQSGTIFIRDRLQGTTRAIPYPGGSQGSLSADGRFLAFVSQSPDIVPDDTNDESDLFVMDLESNEVVRVSLDANGSELETATYGHDFSADGRHIVFTIRNPSGFTIAVARNPLAP